MRGAGNSQWESSRERRFAGERFRFVLLFELHQKSEGGSLEQGRLLSNYKSREHLEAELSTFKGFTDDFGSTVAGHQHPPSPNHFRVRSVGEEPNLKVSVGLPAHYSAALYPFHIPLCQRRNHANSTCLQMQ